jgi:5-methylcytosine-specific restriction endonuclease McrA
MYFTCTICGIEKPAFEFYKRKDTIKGYRSDCKECLNKRSLKRYKKFKHQINIQRKQRYLNTKDIELAKNKRWYQKNRERVIERTSRYQKENRKKLAAGVRKRARKRLHLSKKLDFDYSVKDEAHTYLFFSKVCFKCKSKDMLHIDHHFPLSRGFGLSIENAVLLCRSCNDSKYNKIPEEFYTTHELEIVEFILAKASTEGGL